MAHTGATPRIFISYSHDDEVWKDRVVGQLGVLEHEGSLSVWEDRRIAAGDNWLPEIETAIQSCNVALLLISAKFLTSKFILGACSWPTFTCTAPGCSATRRNCKRPRAYRAMRLLAAQGRTGGC